MFLSPVALLWLCLLSSLLFSFQWNAHFTTTMISSSRLFFTGFYKAMLNFAATQLVLEFVWLGFFEGVVTGKVESWHASAMASRNHLFYHPFIYLYPDQPSCCCLSSNLSLYGEMSSTFGCSFGMSTLKVRGCVSSACAAVEQRGWTRTRTPLHSQAATAQLLSAGMQKSCTSFFKTPSLPPSGPKARPERCLMDSNQVQNALHLMKTKISPCCCNLPKYFNYTSSL